MEKRVSNPKGIWSEYRGLHKDVSALVKYFGGTLALTHLLCNFAASAPGGIVCCCGMIACYTGIKVI